jgi:hypothetical protein
VVDDFSDIDCSGSTIVVLVFHSMLKRVLLFCYKIVRYVLSRLVKADILWSKKTGVFTAD